MTNNPTPTVDLVSLFNEGGMGAHMLDEIRELKQQLYYTPKWRKIKRYNLFEKIDRLEESYALMDHVFNDD